MRIIKQIPNFFTLLNLLSGVSAIVMSFDLPGRSDKKLEYACYMIGIAIIFDFLDGLSARLLKAESKIGKELDSLADIISFGVAPAIFMFHLCKFVYSGQCISCLMFPGIVNYMVLGSGFFIAVFAGIRLAKFNASDDQKLSFKGLPTPAVALLVSSYPIIAFKYESTIFAEIVLNHYFLIGTTVFVCIMMVVNLPMFSLKFTGFAIRENAIRYIFLLISVVLLIIVHYLAVPLIIILYILLSGINHLVIKNN
ncbi:MAG: CDP-alcohol phosphatidyltransferase family protein [Bacteroidota bacterium]